MTKVLLFFEGGARSGNDLALKRSMRCFLAEMMTALERAGHSLQPVPCGSVGRTFERFELAVANPERGSLPILLVDAEELPQGESALHHIRNRSMNQYRGPEVEEWHVQLMTQAMEAFFVADAAGVREFFRRKKRQFLDKFGHAGDVEVLSPARLVELLDALYRHAGSADGYAKGKHQAELLAEVSANRASTRSKWLERLMNLPRLLTGMA